MNIISKITSFFKINETAEELNRERHKALIQQVPIMYAILVVNMVTLIWPHMQDAPMYMTLVVPIALSAIFLKRSYILYKKIDQVVTYDQVLEDLKSITSRAAILGVTFIIWAYFLFQYGMPIMKVHIIFFLCISLICCSFFLMHLLQSVIALTTVILVPSAIYIASLDVAVFKSVAINITFVSVGIIYLLFCQFQNFRNLIRQRSLLSRTKATLIEQAKKLKRVNIELKNSNAELEQSNINTIKLANVDALTSLPNRRSFFKELNRQINGFSKHEENKLIVGLLDLDGFKRINDVFGHPAGDCLLVKAGERLSYILGEKVFLARLGGDEFGVILSQPDDVENVLEIGVRICDSLQQVFDLKEASIQIGTTIGFVEYPAMASTAKLLFERADYALYYSKHHSKGKPLLFSIEHEVLIKEVAEIEQSLNDADLEEELEVVFQPIVDIERHKIVGFESLARWNSSVLGQVRPDVFIEAAEHMGIIGKLTTILLDKSLNAACYWNDDVYMSFNLSIFDLSSQTTILKIISLVEASDFPNSQIVFEVTETSVMNDFEQANESLRMLKRLGVKIALDDFGTGYSSLSYIQRMPLDRLKIDRCFITDIGTDNNSKNIVRTILDLCNNLNLYCIVEGVETVEQLVILREMGVKYIQGYYFSKPLNHTDTAEFLSSDLGIPKEETLSEKWANL